MKLMLMLIRKCNYETTTEFYIEGVFKKMHKNLTTTFMCQSRRKAVHSSYKY